jgi:hypothetical protein
MVPQSFTAGGNRSYLDFWTVIGDRWYTGYKTQTGLGLVNVIERGMTQEGCRRLRQGGGGAESITTPKDDDRRGHGTRACIDS